MAPSAAAITDPTPSTVRAIGATRDRARHVAIAIANAALLAIESGFDAVEIHLGHNYLASAFLSPLINKRNDEFGAPVAFASNVLAFKAGLRISQLTEPWY